LDTGFEKIGGLEEYCGEDARVQTGEEVEIGRRALSAI